MIGSYLAARHGVSDVTWTTWLERNPAWSGQVREVLDNPTGFEAFVTATAATVGDGETSLV